MEQNFPWEANSRSASRAISRPLSNLWAYIVRWITHHYTIRCM